MEATPIRRAFDEILQNPSRYDFRDVVRARKDADLEKQAAERAGVTVEIYRIQELDRLRKYADRIDQHDKEQTSREKATFEQFKSAVQENLVQICMAEGRGPDVPEAYKPVYDAITRYFWGEPTELLAGSKYLMLYGCYGCGKSTLVKSINRALHKIRGREGAWHYIHIPTLVNRAIAEKSTVPFNELFNCQRNMILDEFGDETEKQRIYGDYIDSIRNLVLDKYDKWVTHSHRQDYQRICFTTNLFPNTSSFFTTRRPEDTEGTLQAFYGTKVSDRMQEMCNMVRFPNVNHRAKNVKNILL